MSVGIKETKELLVGVNEVALLLVHRLKDGVGMDDISAVIAKLSNDEDFKAKMSAAYEGVKHVPEEVKDIDLGEVMKLSTMQLMYVPKYLEAASKKQDGATE